MACDHLPGFCSRRLARRLHSDRVSAAREPESTVQGLIGPWGHKEPQEGVPGPAISFLQECLRWWDQYLKGEDRGISRDPALRLWLQDYASPRPHFEERPGRWIKLPRKALRSAESVRLYGQGSRLQKTRSRQSFLPEFISSPQTTGLRAQEWCPYGSDRVSAENAPDQREDDGLSLCLDSAPLTSSINIVGECQVRLRVTADKPQAMLAVRLCDVAPEGSSALITYGLLNLSHRDGHEHPSAIQPGKFYDLTLLLKPVAQVVPKGHRLRIAVSSTYWPMVWPSPEALTLTIDTAHLEIELPAISQPRGVRFEADAEQAAPGPMTSIEPSRDAREIRQDIASQKTTFQAVSDDGRCMIEDTGTEIASKRIKIFEIERDDPTSAATRVISCQEYRRGDWNPKVETEVNVTSDKNSFHIEASVRAYEGKTLFATRVFRETIARDHL
jgi:uncharacterized protein